jgi:type II secretory pathway pseudopilin PulG
MTKANAGIAIGPILFVVAILGILAAAIAAGSGSFSGSSNSEADRLAAAALMEIGDNLKIGMDRLVSSGYDPATVTINPAATTNDNDLFSPTGGGIVSPSLTMSCASCWADNSSDNRIIRWWYPTGTIPNFGTSAVERLAMIEISAGACTQVNQKTNSIATPASANIGIIQNTVEVPAAWPLALKGKPVGCINNNNGNNPGYWFYQVLAIQ